MARMLHLFITVVILFSFTIDALAVEIPKDRLAVNASRPCEIPYLSNHPLDIDNLAITHVIIAIHSSNYDAHLVFDNTTDLLKARMANSTLVISPQFLTNEHVHNINEPNLLYWTTYPYWGSSKSRVIDDAEDMRISAYNILEDLIRQLAQGDRFPNLKHITVLGHSAGGMMTHRFALSNTVDHKDIIGDIDIKYVVMNPSSYVYLNGERPVGKNGSLAIPSDEQINKVPNYNQYGYGLDELYAFHRAKNLTANLIIENYQQRRVIYLIGREDNKQDETLSRKGPAMLQGENRFERARFYRSHLQAVYGSSIGDSHVFRIVPGVGHNGRKMMHSAIGRNTILGTGR